MIPCDHPRPITSDMSDHGIAAEVTVCPDCGSKLDTRPLREVDRPRLSGHTGPSDPPEYEAEIQAVAHALKAREVLEESGELTALPPVVVLSHPTDLEVRASLESKTALVASVNAATGPLSIPAPCAIHGGAFAACDAGAEKANHCRNSQWGHLVTFTGPCGCMACHVWAD